MDAYSFIRSKIEEGCVDLQEIEREFTENFQSFRMISGRRYSGSAMKQFKKCINDKSVFSIMDGQIKLNCSSELVDAYIFEKRKIPKNYGPDKIKVIHHLKETFKEQYKASNSILKRLKGHESLIQCAELMGQERLIGLIIGYKAGRDHFSSQTDGVLDTSYRKIKRISSKVSKILSKIPDLSKNI